MSCDRYAELLAEYADGTLEPSATDSLREHLRECTACAAILRAEATFVERLRSATTATMPDGAKDRLRQLLVSIRKSRAPTFE
jgi:anti-sigma factor RsiW